LPTASNQTRVGCTTASLLENALVELPVVQYPTSIISSPYVQNRTSNRAVLSVIPNYPNHVAFEWLSLYAHLDDFPLLAEDDSSATIATHFLSATVHLEVQESCGAADQGTNLISLESAIFPGEKRCYLLGVIMTLTGLNLR
jgi:hypothetical protein